jgi:uncharacterized membrane protein
LSNYFYYIIFYVIIILFYKNIFPPKADPPRAEINFNFMPDEIKTTNNQTGTDPDVEANKTAAALSYLWILCLIPLLTKKDSKFAQFHAKQGLVLFGIELIASILFWFPVFGQLLSIVLVIVSVIGIIKAYNGEWYKMPYIYDWSLKIKL